MKTNDYFSYPLRRITSGVDINFYANVSNKDAEVGLNWSEEFKARRGAFYNLKWQLNSAGFEPEHKYATLDKNTYLDGTAHPVAVNENLVFPLYSEFLSAKSANDGLFGFPFAENEIPEYSLSYDGFSRKINQVYVVGDVKWEQYPVSYELELTLEEGAEDVDFNSLDDDLLDFDEVTVDSVNERIVEETVNGINHSHRVITMSVYQNRFMRQAVLLPKTYQTTKIKLRVLRWSAAHAAAKIMFFSNDMSISFTGKDIAFVSVLEEKAANAEQLSYGITSNSCDLEISNYNDRFIRYRDLLRKNRTVMPYVSCTQTVEGEEKTQTYPLGKFYSDDWEISATSNFISCKAYDILYNLQTVQLFYPMEKVADGKYVLDKQKNALQVFEKIFSLINKERQNSGIIGSDIMCRIDPRLKKIIIPYVLLGCDTAWNMLLYMANLTLSNVYADRDGTVCVVRDDFPNEQQSEIVQGNFHPDCDTQITPDNCFSYNLPSMSKTIVNRVTVPYVELVDEVEDIETAKMYIVQKKDFIYNRNDAGEIESAEVNVRFDKFCYGISVFDSCKNDALEENKFQPLETQIAHDGCRVKFTYDETVESVVIVITATKIIETSETNTIETTTTKQYFTLKEGEITKDDFQSQRLNGVHEYIHASRNLIVGAKNADKIADSILDGYGKGRTYIETEWIGSPLMTTGSVFDSYSNREPQPQTYECLSNEFTIDGGLRARTKARQKKKAPA